MNASRKWPRLLLGAVVTLTVFGIYMHILEGYDLAKAQQRSLTPSTALASRPSIVVQTGRVPLSVPALEGDSVENAVTGAGSVVVLSDNVHLRTRPSISATALKTLRRGQRLTYVDTEGDFYRVRFKSPAFAFVSADPESTRLEPIR